MSTTQLTFSANANGKGYTATASVSGNFALHLEMSGEATVKVCQSSDSNGTRPALTDLYRGLTELDVQYAALFPATITIESTQPVTYGSVTE